MFVATLLPSNVVAVWDNKGALLLEYGPAPLQLVLMALALLATGLFDITRLGLSIHAIRDDSQQLLEQDHPIALVVPGATTEC